MAAPGSRLLLPPASDPAGLRPRGERRRAGRGSVRSARRRGKWIPTRKDAWRFAESSDRTTPRGRGGVRRGSTPLPHPRCVSRGTSRSRDETTGLVRTPEDDSEARRETTSPTRDVFHVEHLGPACRTRDRCTPLLPAKANDDPETWSAAKVGVARPDGCWTGFVSRAVRGTSTWSRRVFAPPAAPVEGAIWLLWLEGVLIVSEPLDRGSRWPVAGLAVLCPGPAVSGRET